MRGYGHELELDTGSRPTGDRVERDEPGPGLLGRAAAAGRTDVLGHNGMLGLQRAAGNAAVGAMMEEERSPVHDVINSGGGSALDPGTRADMEARFGQDFGDVRVHTGSAAHDSAKSVNAHAYTVGSNIVFQRDKYDPGSEAGQHMLAHELTHVVQQRSGPVSGTDAGGGIKVSDPSDRFERDAVANADRLMSAPVAVSGTGPAGQHRAADSATQAATQVAAHQAPVQREEAPEAAEEGDEQKMAQTYVQREDEEQEDAG